MPSNVGGLLISVIYCLLKRIKGLVALLHKGIYAERKGRGRDNAKVDPSNHDSHLNSRSRVKWERICALRVVKISIRTRYTILH